MATVTVATAEYVLGVEDASIVGLEVDGSGHLIATKGSGDTEDIGAVSGETPDASETVKGILELATNAEVAAGTDVNRAVTPQGLKTQLDLKQPLDSDLTAIAAIAPADDDFIQRKSGIWVNRTVAQVVTDLLATGSFASTPPDATTTVKGIVELATSAETITGTDTVRAITPAGGAAAYQPLDSDLTAIAALATANDGIMQRKAGAWTGRTLAQVSYDLNGGNVQVLTDGATINTDVSLGDHFRVTLGGNRTLGIPTNPKDGQRVIWEFIQDGTGSRTITLTTGSAGAFLYGTDIPSIGLTTTASKRDLMGAIYNSSLSRWLVTAFVKGF